MATIFVSRRAVCGARPLSAGVSCRNFQLIPPLLMMRMLLVLLLVCCCHVSSYTYGYGYGASRRQRGGQLPVSSNRCALFGALSDAAQSNITDPAEACIDDETFLDEFGHPIEEKRVDYVGAGTLGDIMSSDDGFRFSEEARGGIDRSADVDEVTTYATATSSFTTTREDGDALTHDEGLVTTAGGTLQARFGKKIPRMSPLERITLTSNGNLQRIFSSYYDAPVHVHVDRCEMRNFDNQGVNHGDGGDGGSAVWDREVHLSVHSQRFCTARSVVTVRSEDCIRLVHSGEVGIGQLFRALDRLPTFEILDAGRRLEDGGMWRTYTLECRELSCVIREDFVSNAWSIEPTSLNANE